MSELPRRSHFIKIRDLERELGRKDKKMESALSATPLLHNFPQSKEIAESCVRD